MKFKLKKIAGDASFRQFYRLYKKDKTSILVISKKEKFKNLIAYSAVNKFLRKHKILAPKLLNESFKRGMIEIEDFGNVTFDRYLKTKKNKYQIYKKIIYLLIKIQKIKPPRLINLIKNYRVYLEYYNSKNLHKESDLFFDWYLQAVIGKKKAKKYKILIRRELNKIYNKIYFPNIFFVHRDFHVSNLMLTQKNKIALIDNQDSIIGNPAYDLVSLIDDVRIKTSSKLKNQIFDFFLNKTEKNFKNKKVHFVNDFNILSIQRSLKILGIFYRLFKRDKKIKYLKLMPYTWKLLELRLQDKMFKNLRILLSEAVGKKLRSKTSFK